MAKAGYLAGLQFSIVMLLSNMDFHDILMCDNLLYCAALFLELCAMVRLRISQVLCRARLMRCWDSPEIA